MSKELIERLRADAESTDDIGLCADAAERIEELERDLLNLVCRIHRDGGHYIAKYGEAKAIADADTVAAQNNADLDALQADNAELVAALKPFGAIDLVESRLPAEFAMLILRARAALAKAIRARGDTK